VARKVFLGMRVGPDLKDKLEEVASAEERSVSQVCELMLRKAMEAYEKEGSKYLQRHPSQQKKKRP
jgi:hypothetical protein